MLILARRLTTTTLAGSCYSDNMGIKDTVLAIWPLVLTANTESGSIRTRWRRRRRRRPDEVQKAIFGGSVRPPFRGAPSLWEKHVHVGPLRVRCAHHSHFFDEPWPRPWRTNIRAYFVSLSLFISFKCSRRFSFTFRFRGYEPRPALRPYRGCSRHRCRTRRTRQCRVQRRAFFLHVISHALSLSDLGPRLLSSIHM